MKEEVEEGKLNGKMVMINNSGIRKSGREKKWRLIRSNRRWIERTTPSGVLSATLQHQLFADCRPR